jgi:hypothetical protein
MVHNDCTQNNKEYVFEALKAILEKTLAPFLDEMSEEEKT